MAQRILGVKMTGKNILLAIAFMVATYVAIRVVGMFALVLTSGFLGLVVSAVVGFLLFAAYMRGR
jgi:hypothetical protein